MMRSALIVCMLACLLACQHVPAKAPPAPQSETTAPVIVFSRLPDSSAESCTRLLNAAQDKVSAWKTYATKLEGLLGITPDKSRPADETD